MNEEQCWHPGRVDFDGIHCQAATPKLSTETKTIICLPVINSATFIISPQVLQHKS